MKSTRNRRKTDSAEVIARRADRGEDVSSYFTNSGRMRAPIQRVNVDFAAPMLNELDDAAKVRSGQVLREPRSTRWPARTS
jgi:hypothetical protein